MDFDGSCADNRVPRFTRFVKAEQGRKNFETWVADIDVINHQKENKLVLLSLITKVQNMAEGPNPINLITNP
jgi:hypothetical protein